MLKNLIRLATICSILATTVVLALPEGFKFKILTDKVPAAGQMAEASDGTLFVGSSGARKIYAVNRVSPDAEPTVTVVDEGLTLPMGVALHEGSLYVGDLNRVLRYPNILATYQANPEPEVITDKLPKDRHHGGKYLVIDDQGAILLNVGAPCNICLRNDDPRYASIVKVDPKTGDSSVYAHGVRNSVGMTWHPVTGHLWFTDNGRDWLGDDLPPEEINIAEKAGLHFGYPFVHAGDILDPEFGDGQRMSDYVPPVVKIQAHSAALGLKFYTGDQFPADYKNALFVAEHGSWNRSSKVGYRVSVVTFDGDKPTYQPFIDRWLDGQSVSGRPRDVLVTASGSLLIADDLRGSIYEITYP